MNLVLAGHPDALWTTDLAVWFRGLLLAYFAATDIYVQDTWKCSFKDELLHFPDGFAFLC